MYLLSSFEQVDDIFIAFIVLIETVILFWSLFTDMKETLPIYAIFSNNTKILNNNYLLLENLCL